MAPPHRQAIGLQKRRLSGWRQLRYYFYRFARLKGTPRAIARGLAAGVFSGWFPWFGLQIVIAVALAALVRGNKLVAAAATWISNPLTSLPILAFNYEVGRWILGGKQPALNVAQLQTWESAKNLGTELLEALFLGSLVMGSITAIASYFLGYWLVQRIRQQRLDRRMRRSR